MKTIRDALLQRRQSATPKLDAIRARVLAAEFAPQPSPPVKPLSLDIVSRLWRELFWTSRRVWAGLAAAWCLILFLNLALAGDEPGTPVRTAQNTPTAAQLRLALAEQKHLRAELLALLSTDSAPPPEASESRPRSEYQRPEAMA